MHISRLLALGAIVLWASLAMLGVRLAHLPPFWLTGVALLIGSVVALPLSRLDLSQFRVPLPTLVLGVYGLFGFHFLLFIALRHAPPVQANLVNYLWPLGMVVLAPVILPGLKLSLRQLLAALTQRVPAFPTAAIGLFSLVSGTLSLLCHVWLEPPAQVAPQDWLWLVLMGLGPLGAAFFLWDAALKRGDARQIGLLSFLTPLLSTLLLLWHRGEAITGSVAVAAALIVGAAWIGRSR